MSMVKISRIVVMVKISRIVVIALLANIALWMAGCAESKEPSEEEGFSFTYQNAVISVQEDAALILDILGQPISYFEAASCASEGLDKIYTYEHFEIDTYPYGDEDYISAIVFKDDLVMTSEGLCIGDSRTRMIELYGENYDENVGMIVYQRGGMRLCFVIQDDMIISIEYRAIL